MDRALLDRLIGELKSLRESLDSAGTRAQPMPAGAVNQAVWLQGLLALSPDVISVLDREGRLLYLSRAADGRNPADFVGHLAREYLPETERHLWDEAFRLVLETGQPQHFEIHSKGDYWWDTRLAPLRGPGGTIDHVISLGADVTRRRRAEVALTLRDQMLALALEASGMGLWCWDASADRVTVDSNTRQLLDGLTDAEPLQLATLLERVHPEDRERLAENLRGAVRTGRSPELEFRVNSSAQRWLLLKGKVSPAVFGGDGVTLLGAIVDLTGSKQKEEGLQRAQKLEAIGQLAGGVAHDFNNLLVAITGSIELARREPEQSTRDALLLDALTASQRAAELTRQLLVFGRRQPLHETAIDLNDLLRDVLKLLRRLIPESIEIDFIAGHRIPPVLGDRGQIEQVVLNICINARDAMPAGGRLVIETETVLVNGRFRETHPWARPGRYALLSVSDSGEGMRPEVLERIFEPFFTTKDHGTGLGLATAYGIVKQHGGLLHAYSEVGKGSTFKVYLPIASRDAAEVGPKIEEPVAGGSEVILLAEDEDSVRAIVQRILEQAGYEVRVARDGQEAVDLFERAPTQIDLVVVDAIMPRKNGSQALGEMRKLRPDLPVIVSSGYSDSLASFRQAGVTFLQKPYEPDALLRVVRAVLDRRR